jgi:glyoxylase-like metal-dependent hydrolase (beta-lactamase superfamily II)
MTVGVETIVDGLHRLDVPLGDRFVSLYLAVGDTSALLFDTGTNGMIPQQVLPALAQVGVDPRDVRSVVVSHCDVDHFGGVADAREAFPQAQLAAHALERPAIEDYGTYLSTRARGFVEAYGWDEDRAVLDWCRSVTRETPLDSDLVDGQIIDLGGREAIIRHVPGHSRGHLAVDLPWASAILVSDAVLGSSVNTVDGTPAFPPTYRFVDDYLATINTIEALDRRMLLTAHYPTFEGERAREFLAESRAFVERLDALVVSSITESPQTLAELLAVLNPSAGDWPEVGTQGALAFPVVGHLERMLERGQAKSAGTRDGIPLWSAA